jgi:hypothetical protein
MDNLDAGIFLECPHCSQLFETTINTINCAIYRHGVLKTDFSQMNPHTPKNECDMLYNTEKIYGCGKPFKVILSDNVYKAVVCDYI